MGQHAGAIEVKFITDYDILAQHCHILHAHLEGEALLTGHMHFPAPVPTQPSSETYPLAHTAAPAHDA